MTTVFGIPNCDTVKKARNWLSDQGIDYRFHDFRKDGLEAAQLRGWVKRLGWEVLLNTRGTSWRKLPENERQCDNADRAIALMLATPSLIKRPVIEHGAHLTVGFTETVCKTLTDK